MKATFAKFSPVFGIISLLNFSHSVGFIGAFLGGSDGKDPPAMRETWIQSLDWEDPLEKGMASTHSSILAWRTLMHRGAWWASPWGGTESDMTERLSFSLFIGFIGISLFFF